ncbi:Glycosyltransferase family 92 protein [Porphyridium purpureum]|uniref:Glycosyltransferase family 92 protein n=1 Tax=Porphyridium purpureum TaxID=35688 RepID=A0A5J4Z994_PORPP|nr:Glycosyltransferase family 92 protein [Porphyridium purpureum]|eukprot:POR6211..scf295_1
MAVCSPEQPPSGCAASRASAVTMFRRANKEPEQPARAAVNARHSPRTQTQLQVLARDRWRRKQAASYWGTAVLAGSALAMLACVPILVLLFTRIRPGAGVLSQVDSILPGNRKGPSPLDEQTTKAQPQSAERVSSENMLKPAGSIETDWMDAVKGETAQRMTAAPFIERAQCGSWQFGPYGKRNIKHLPIGAIESAWVVKAYRETSVKYEVAFFVNLAQNLRKHNLFMLDLKLALDIADSGERIPCDNGYESHATELNVIITCAVPSASRTEQLLETNFRVVGDLVDVDHPDHALRNLGLCLNEPLRAAREPTSALLERALSLDPTRGKLAVCLYMRNVRWRLLEWLTYHFAQGVDHIYIYKNEGDEFTDTFLHKFIEDGTVTIAKWAYAYTGVVYDRSQSTSINECLWTLRYKYEWIGVFDVDEFWVSRPDPKENLVQFLDRPELSNASAVRLSTIKHCFGPEYIAQAGPNLSERGIVSHVSLRSLTPDNWKNFIRPHLVGWAWIHAVQYLKAPMADWTSFSVDRPFFMHVQAVELLQKLGMKAWRSHTPDPSCVHAVEKSAAQLAVPNLEALVQRHWQEANRSSFELRSQPEWDKYYDLSQDFEPGPCTDRTQLRKCWLEVET